MQKSLNLAVSVGRGSKFRAVNSKKNNFNSDKIERHQDYINKKTEDYLAQLDEYDKQEQGSDEIKIKREAIAEQLKKLKERKLKYDELARENISFQLRS